MTRSHHFHSFCLGALLLAAGSSPALATMPPRTGTLPPEVAEALAAGMLRLPEPPASLTTNITGQAQTDWNLPVLLVGFSDAPVQFAAAEFDVALFDSTSATPTGSVFDYYTWASRGRMRIRGRVVATVQLPETRSYYGFGNWGLNRIATPNNAYGFVRDALLRCHAGVTWAPFDQTGDGYVDMLWVIHSGVGGEASTDRNNLWSITSAMTGYWNNASAFETNELVPGSTAQRIRLDRFTILPELSALDAGQRSEIGVYCHEFGHALGLPDLYDTSALGGAANVGPGNWSLMATGGWGGNNATPEYPTHLGAWPLLFLGWGTTVRPEQDSTMVLPPVADGGPIVELWSEGRPNHEHFLLENRQRAGFDRYLPNAGLVVYQLDESIIGQRLQSNNINVGPTPGLRIIEADGEGNLRNGTNRGDASDPFPGGANRTFIYDESSAPNTLTLQGRPSNVAIVEIASQGSDVHLTAQVRAPGWSAPADRSQGPFAPLPGPATPRRAGVDDAGDVYGVTSELRNGRPQIVLRARRGDEWQPLVEVSQTTAEAREPSIAVLPGGDLAVVWADSRTGRLALMYRGRIRGAWTPEFVLSNRDGNVRYPSAAADRLGNVFVAWVQDNGPFGPIYTMRFTYLSPFGVPFAVTSGLEAPLAPTIAARGDGGAVIAWPDRAITPQTLFFSHFHPDSGVSPRRAIWTPSAGRTQMTASVAVDGDRALHVIWPESGPGLYQLHYQRRGAGVMPTLPDTTLEAAEAPVQSPSLTTDPEGGLHLAYESLQGGITRVRYRRWRAGLGWDDPNTTLSDPDAGSVTSPAIAASGSAEVTVLYTAFPGGVARLMERRRSGDLPAALAVAPPRAAPVSGVLSAAPNPLRAGGGLEIVLRDAAAAPGDYIDVFDLAGRRMATVALAGPPGARRARLDASETTAWPAGIYLLRARPGRVAAQRVVVLR